MIAPVAAPVAAQPEAPVANERQADSVRSSVDFPDELLAAIGLGVVGIGIAGFVASRRRRRVVAGEEVYDAEPAYVAEPPITSIPDELAVRTPAQPAYVPATAFSMPGGPVPSGEARQHLLDEMVAAAPDEANPFTSAKARRKRARIILQSRELKQREQATEPFDWRTYRSPAITDAASPPMVDA